MFPELAASTPAVLQTPVEFDQAAAFLRYMRLPTARRALYALDRFRFTTEAANILRKYGDGRFDVNVLLISGIRDLANNPGGYFLAQVEAEAFKLLDSLFPLEIDQMEEVLYNLEEGSSCGILIMNPGFYYSYDEFDEAVRDPEIFGENGSLLALAALLSTGVDDDDWDTAARHFQWPPDRPDPRVSCDPNVLLPLLEENGLSDVCAAFRMVWQTTGSMFLDLNSEEIWNAYIPFDVPSVARLLAEWEKAQPFIDSYNRAMEQFNQDHTIVSKIITLWNRSGGPENPRTTLAELWACGDLSDEDDDEDNEGEVTLIDPFYGPIGPDTNGVFNYER